MIGLMKVDKLSVSFDPELGDAVRDAAKRAGRGLSGWLAEAAEAKLRSEALGDFLDGWEAEHGVLTGGYALQQSLDITKLNRLVFRI